MSTLNPPESFTLSIKLALYAGIVISFPFLLFFLAEFILPGLHNHEKKLMAPALLIGFGLFLTGVLFSYFVVTPRALEFFSNYTENLGMENDWRIGYYVAFVTQLTLVFGLCFELPVVVMALVKLELLSYEMMRNTRPYAIVIIFFVSALITPTTDVITLFMLGAPMTVLYEICIWLAYFSNRKQRKIEAKEEAERQERIAALALTGTAPEGEEGDGHEDDPYHPYHDDYHDHHHHDGDDHDDVEDAYHDPDYYPGHHENYHDDPEPEVPEPKPASGTVATGGEDAAEEATPSDGAGDSSSNDSQDDTPSEDSPTDEPQDDDAEEEDDHGDHHNDPYRQDDEK